MSATLSSLEAQPPELLQKVALAYSLADLSEDNEPIVRAIAEDSEINDLRDMALKFNVARLAAIVDTQTLPETITAETDREDTYRKAKISFENVTLTGEDEKELQKLYQETLDRAVDAEFLGLTQEDYIILTKEAFWSKRYFDITLKKEHTEAEYRQNIGVKPVYEYYNYQTEAEMLSTDETAQQGLTFVKNQFLPRTGIQYVDLVEILKTQFINPNFPQGRALTILDSIRFSYRFLQTLVDNSSSNPQVKFAKLIEFLEKVQPLVPLLDAFLHPDPCQQQKPNWSMDHQDLRNWVYCYFERIGKLITLELREGLKLPIEGSLFTMDLAESFEPKLVGYLGKDGTIVDRDGITIGNVTITGLVIGVDGKPFIQRFEEDTWLQVIPEPEKRPIGFIDSRSLIVGSNRETQLNWLPAQDTCNLDKVRLIHLDGTQLEVEEYDRIQRFIRLWHKMGWKIDETDKALAHNATSPICDQELDYVGFEMFKDNFSEISGDRDDDFDCPDLVEITAEITPHFLHQLVAVKKLLDLTGLELAKLLTFWTNISTNGEKSLYKRLFLTHNLLGIDEVFKPDKHGNYLTASAKISEHLPVLMAALRLKADDITAVVEFRQLDDDLTLTNVSVLYRHSLLAKVLGIKLTELLAAIELFGDPFENTDNTLEMLETWGKMEDTGFSFPQLNYIIGDSDNDLRPVAPSQKIILQIAKTLDEGLNKIEQDHPLIKEENQEEATTDLVRAKAGLFFEQSVVEQIIGLLEGTTVYTTNAPANQTISVPDNLAAKIQYKNQANANPPQATLKVTGILTDTEQKQAKALSNHPEWAKALARVAKQAENFFNDVLFGIFSDIKLAKSRLLAGDVNLPTGVQDSRTAVTNTAVQKRFFFLQHFILFLRQQLSHRLIIETLSGVASLPSDVTDLLLTEVLVVGEPPQSAISALQKIKEVPADNSSGWQGYLIPSVDDSYIFIAIGDTQPAPLMLDGQSVSLPHQQEDPSNVWWSDPVKLKAGKLYYLVVSDRSGSQLHWKTATSPKAQIPTSALLPDYSKQGTEEVLTKLSKAALLVNGFNLSTDEISYWQNNSVDFDDFDFNKITLQHWQRLHAYTTLRNSLPRTETNLLDLFNWAKTAENPTELSAKIAAATVWKQNNIAKLIDEKHFDLNRLDAFRNEVNLVKLQKALAIADKIGVEIDKLFEWAKPTSKFWDCHQIAEDIRKAIRARFNQEDWEQVVKPLNDELRNHQKQALIDYLLVQQVLRNWGVVDADSLFEFFLIDVQMDTCMETSRIKQGISSIQLFIQRCLLGLEEKYGVKNQVLDRDRWGWMQRYRVWEANRKVFLYPENWLEPELRDDKSPFYKELESELLQKDINQQTVQDAIKSYLFKVDEVANLKVVGLFLEQELDRDGKLAVDESRKPVYFKLHIFARTRNAPYFFYYRYFHIKEGNWYPWEKVQERGKIQPQTYNSLLDKWDAFGNAMVELELAFPFSNQTHFPLGVSNDVVGLANVFGFATSLYFCIPDNPKLRGLRKTIDDRLFQIRNCENIEGVFRKPPLFEPPIDPALLVQAAAKGLSLSSMLNDLNTPAPNYRFYYLLQKALELCTELKSLGNAFLSAKEKKDAEGLSQLRASHESSIHNLVMEVRKKQLKEVNKSLEALQQSRKSPVYRLQHYLKLIGKDLAAVPGNNTDFKELPNQIEKPVDKSGLKLSKYEKEEIDKASYARYLQIDIGAKESIASLLSSIPNFSAKFQPFGAGGSISFGGSNLGSAAQAEARILQIFSNDLSYQSTNASRKGGFLRQLQDRVQQANIAGYEIKNIDKQILTQQIRINIAQQEITNQQKQIDNAQEVEEFLRNKYTNQELYAWMEGEIKTLYYQAYTLAYDIAKKAEKVFRFERGLTTSNFIQFGYWDAARDGLLAGERLYLGLKQLEAAYQEKRGYDYEVSKSISLRQINPLALLQLKETGTCEFALPEVLFDMDFPGHYMRRIKSIALTVPCVVGPYTSLNCTLRLLEHKFRISAIAKDKNDYLEKIDKTDDRFRTDNVHINAIAVSTGQNDSGMFELNFQGDRYLPFEGAGAISKWRIELPSEFRQFDYDTITDVVLQMRYTAVEGGDKLKKPAADSVLEYIKSVEELSREEGLFAAFDLKNEFASEWYKAMNPPKDATERVLTLNNLRDRLPIFTKGRAPKKIQATDIYLLTPSALTASKLVLKHNSEEETFTDGVSIGSMKSFVIKVDNFPIVNWEISIQDIETELDKLWLIVRYVLK